MPSKSAPSGWLLYKQYQVWLLPNVQLWLPQEHKFNILHHRNHFSEDVIQWYWSLFNHSWFFGPWRLTSIVPEKQVLLQWFESLVITANSSALAVWTPQTFSHKWPSGVFASFWNTTIPGLHYLYCSQHSNLQIPTEEFTKLWTPT